MSTSDSKKDGGAGPSGTKAPAVDLKSLAENQVKIPTLPTFPLDRQLTSNNWSIWCIIMLAVLDSYELTELVKDIPKPQDPDEASLWERVNGRIRSFIILNVTLTVLEHIKHFTSAWAIWTHLASLFARVSPMKRVSLEV